MGSSASIPGQVNFDNDRPRPRSAGRSSLHGSTTSTALIGDSSAAEQASSSQSQSSLRSGDRVPLL